MSKKVLFICGGGSLPRKDGNGNAVLTFGIVNVLLKLGFEVVITPVSIRCTKDKLKTDLLFLEEQLGVSVIQFQLLLHPKSNSLKKWNTWKRLFITNEDVDYFYSKIDAHELLEHIQGGDYTHVYGYDWDAVSLLSFLGQEYTTIISLVDILDVFFESKRKLLFKKLSLQTPLDILSWALGKNKVNVGYEYLKACDLIVEHASQHADQLREKGFTNVFYIPHPILKKTLSENQATNSKVIISMIGSLKGVSSQLGYHFFVNELYPQVMARLQEVTYDFEFRVIGYGQLPSHLHNTLKQLKYVNFLGFVENVEEQYHEADIILVPIPVSHGFRTRIAEAFSYRKCVVAHSANADGMPEVENGTNALISENASELASMIVRVINSPRLRGEIANNALATFDSKISVDVATSAYGSFL